MSVDWLGFWRRILKEMDRVPANKYHGCVEYFGVFGASRSSAGGGGGNRKILDVKPGW